MVNYQCIKCKKCFKQKCHYIEHTEKKKKPCVEKIIIKSQELTKNNNI